LILAGIEPATFRFVAQHLNRLNAELNPICHLLALLGAHLILHVSRIRVKNTVLPRSPLDNYFYCQKLCVYSTEMPIWQLYKTSSFHSVPSISTPYIKRNEYDIVCTNKTLVRPEKLAVARYGETVLNPVTQFPEELQDKLRLPSSHYRDPTGAAIFLYYRWDSMWQGTFTPRHISYSNVLLRFVHRQNK